MLTIRPHRPEELPRLRQILVEAFDGVSIDQGMQHLYGTIAGHDWQWRKGRHLDADLERDPEGVFTAEVDGQVVGMITTALDREAGIGLVPNLVLVPEARGKGYGRRMLEFAFDRFRRAGLTHAKIETLVQNEVGRHLYESVGFREVARQIHFLAPLDGPPPPLSRD